MSRASMAAEQERAAKVRQQEDHLARLREVQAMVDRGMHFASADQPYVWAAAQDFLAQGKQALQEEQRQLAADGRAVVRTFASGANRDVDEGKLDFEGFLSPLVLQRFAEYMHKNRHLKDGSLRDSDNWQKGIPPSAYVKSLWRHFFAVWAAHRRGELDLHEEELCALIFNTQGLLHEVLKAKAKVGQLSLPLDQREGEGL